MMTMTMMREREVNAEWERIRPHKKVLASLLEPEEVRLRRRGEGRGANPEQGAAAHARGFLHGYHRGTGPPAHAYMHMHARTRTLTHATHEPCMRSMSCICVVMFTLHEDVGASCVGVGVCNNSFSSGGPGGARREPEQILATATPHNTKRTM